MGSDSSASREAIGVLRQAMTAYAAAFDASLMLPADARSVVRDAAAVENMAAAIKAKAAARASEDGQWRREGAPSPAHALARESGSSVTAARQALETAEKMAELPELDAAARRGEVSPAQAAPIAAAASKDPKSEQRLLEKAKRRRWASCETSATAPRRRPSPTTRPATRPSGVRASCAGGAPPMAPASSPTPRPSTRWPRSSPSPRAMPKASSTRLV